MWLGDERSSAKWCVVACLATGIRYESLFVVMLICAHELISKRYRQAGAIVIGAALPVVVYGGYAIVHGGAAQFTCC